MQVVRIDRKGQGSRSGCRPRKRSDNENVVWVALGKGGPWRITFDKTQRRHVRTRQPF